MKNRKLGNYFKSEINEKRGGLTDDIAALHLTRAHPFSLSSGASRCFTPPARRCSTPIQTASNSLSRSLPCTQRRTARRRRSSRQSISQSCSTHCRASADERADGHRHGHPEDHRHREHRLGHRLRDDLRQGATVNEPAIIINGKTLSTAQAMTVRVALGSFAHDMAEPNALGDDEHGRAMAMAYAKHLRDIFLLMMLSKEL